MPSETNRAIQDAPAQEPILELWRILALALIVAAGMLFVHLVVPAEADAAPVATAQIAGAQILR
ncbi:MULTISPECIES: hypothetical protein [Methylobacterium]|jgi:hypothetical protein|uniref:hypothetical protein n=1 Tax=Methylobacterium TaxID=407 RepID=UPI00034B2C87|nr:MULTISPECIES: hypothetical protein [Methylobacterium]MBN4094268.1 hypothetical protein [Methylobacterium sp. OT2]UIN33309.1 hypothetical protein LXM90_19720 [Methylobacterium oryzae]SEG27309.1 hypothetical protein SAMN04488144_112178 [Methylobacterium sp. 190mf]SFD48913.1 hypothetical protein SAMN02799627_00688 [Methylobacterium sp. 13MFTsu3.1M2]